MKFIIKSKEVEVSENLKSYAEKRFEKLEKFLNDVDKDLIQATVEFSKAIGNQRQGEIFQADINLSLPGKFFRSEVKGDNLYSLIDDSKEELETEIRKYKTKKETMFKRGARSLKKIYNISPMARFKKTK